MPEFISPLSAIFSVCNMKQEAATQKSPAYQISSIKEHFDREG